MLNKQMRTIALFIKNYNILDLALEIHNVIQEEGTALVVIKENSGNWTGVEAKVCTPDYEDKEDEISIEVHPFDAVEDSVRDIIVGEFAYMLSIMFLEEQE